MCLDVEHALKTRLLKDIEDNPEEDGYDIIRRFITKYERSCQNIQKHKSSEYCRELTSGRRLYRRKSEKNNCRRERIT